MTQHRNPGPARRRAPTIKRVAPAKHRFRRHATSFASAVLLLSLAIVVGTQSGRIGVPDAADLNLSSPSAPDAGTDLRAALPAAGPSSGLGTAAASNAPATAATGPASTASPKPASTTSGSTAGSPATVPLALNGRTQFGATIWPQNGEGYANALKRTDAAYGGLDLVRVFYSGLPAPWPGPAGLSGRPVAVSFRAAPSAVVAGTYDAAMTAWFKNAPTDRNVYWIYSHEPEDNVARGEFSTASYRAAWRHLRLLADKAGNSRLRATLTLMCWTTGNSGRTPTDFYPGSDVIDVIAFDCYNWAGRKGAYADPSKIYSNGISWAKTMGKPFAFAETGSIRIAGDSSGTQRAAWLRSVATYLDAQGAQFVAYFDVKLATDYRLTDQPSQAAWRAAVSS